MSFIYFFYHPFLRIPATCVTGTAPPACLSRAVRVRAGIINIIVSRRAPQHSPYMSGHVTFLLAVGEEGWATVRGGEGGEGDAPASGKIPDRHPSPPDFTSQPRC